jgi:hypothetical protein
MKQFAALTVPVPLFQPASCLDIKHSKPEASSTNATSAFKVFLQSCLGTLPNRVNLMKARPRTVHMYDSF